MSTKLTPCLLVCIIAAVISFSCSDKTTSGNANPYENYQWQDLIRKDHPRVFFNKSDFSQVKARALKEENTLFQDMKSRVDRLIGQKIEFKEPYVTDGTQNTDHEYGFRAAEAAFVYLVTEDRKYLELTKYLLGELSAYYTLRNKAGLNIHWYAFSRISALCAYDWIYNDLSRQEKVAIGQPLLSAINGMMLDGKRKAFFRENTGNYTTGYYGPPCLAWYAGLVFHKTGIDDTLSQKLLRKGYDDYQKLLEYRAKCAGDDGGSASAVLGYCMGAYPWAEFTFFHTFHSATGLEIWNEWPYVPDFLYFIFWNWLPGDKEFGYGDAYHLTNNIPLGSLHIHLSQMIHFYGSSSPDLVSLARWLQTKVKRQTTDVLPFTRFLLTRSFDEIEGKEPNLKLPSAMHFENMGQVFMRSGSGPEDTYALFTAGGILKQHRHYDNNNFVIFKKGFRALDTGNRPEPGQHLTHYYCRTVAHNCILIRMPGEKMPVYWGGPAASETPLPIPNDGGQSDLLGSQITAYDENKDFVYIASDATRAYHRDKARYVIRQFVFLPPDHFVVFDKIVSTKPEYTKTWLLHTASEPEIRNNEFTEAFGDGRLFCRTVFPRKARMTKTGGPGKQFWSDGRNWTLPVLTPDDWTYRRSSKVLQDTIPLLGQWRVEVSPPKAQIEDCLLHLIQVGDRSLNVMVNSELIRTEDMIGVTFEYNSKKYQVMFKTGKDTGGKISILEKGQKYREEEFTTSVKLQQGMF